MKLFAVFCIFVPVFVNTQDAQDPPTDPYLVEPLSSEFSSTTCEQKVIESLVLLILPLSLSYNTMCDPNTLYFQGCRDPILISCNTKFGSDDKTGDGTCGNYMYWMDAFTVGGKKFTCSVGLNNLTDVFMNKGGSSCITKEVGQNLTQSIHALKSFLGTPQKIGCSVIKVYIDDILNLLKSCNDKTLFNLAQVYFKEVDNDSPCLGGSNSGPKAPSMATSMVLLSTVLFYGTFSFIF